MNATLVVTVCCAVAFTSAAPAAFAEQEYTLEFGLLLNEATANEAERGYLAVIERAKTVPSVEFDVVEERVTNNCETVVKTDSGVFASRT